MSAEPVIISQIKMTKKGRYALFCGDEFLFSVDEQTFADYGICKGREFSEAEFEKLQRSSGNRRALDAALELLGAREHAAGELKQKLMRRFDEPTAQWAVQRARQLGFIDDESFARRYARELIERRLCSRRAAQAKLTAKGVARDIAADAVAEYDDAATAACVVAKKYPNGVDAEKRDKVRASLLRAGFSAAAVRAALAGGDEEFFYE